MEFLNLNTSRLVMRTLPPLIKFRKGGNVKVEASGGSSIPSQAKGPMKATSASGTVLTETPARYRRKDLSQEEIDYINRGGPA